MASTLVVNVSWKFEHVFKDLHVSLDMWTLTCVIFVLLVLTCGLLQLRQKQIQTDRPYLQDPLKCRPFRALQRYYFLAFFLALFSDWLQGPYVYKLYSAYGFPESQIAMLYVVGFGSSAAFGTFTGVLADTFGRRRATQVFCVVYALCCLSKISPNFYVLLSGRIFGGIATSMLFCTFESWYVYEHTVRHNLPAEWMSDTFSRATFWNGVLAIVAGVLANFVAETMGFGPVAPFILAIPDLLLCLAVITCTWPENYGSTQHRFVKSCMDGVYEVSSSKMILMLAVIQSLFEGTMYVFVFLWTPILDFDGGAPLGLIFACFMVCIMIGSSVHQLASGAGHRAERILLGALILGFFSMLVSFAATSDKVRPNISMAYIAFIIFEVAIGIYFPAIGYLRSRIVPENHRTSIMNWTRLPMNVLTAVGLLWFHSGSAQHGNGSLFAVCVLVLSVACLVGLRFAESIAQKYSDAKYTGGEINI